MVKQIIKEAMEHNPLGLKEAVAEELRNRISEALEVSMNEDYWVLYIDGKKWKSYRTDAFAKADAKEARRSGKEAKIVKVKGDFKESVDLEEAKMTDAEVLSAAKALAANGKDEKTKAFGKGLVDFYKKEGSFTPAQVGGLQNIMKNASFQMAKESVELSEVDMGQARSVQDRRDSAKSSSGNKYHVVNKNGNVVSSHDNQGDAMRAAMKNDDYRVKRVS